MSTLIDPIGITPAAAGITGVTNTIQKIAPPVRPGQEEEAPTALDQVKDSAFGSLFSGLIQAQYLLATGQLDNPVQVGISAYKAEISLDLLIQLRNRALDAYNELKNMNV